MLILGIDPSIAKMGIAILDNDKLIQVGTITTKTEEKERLLEIAMQVKNIILKYKPDVLAIETQYIPRFSGNAVLKTSEVKGICRGIFMVLNPGGKVFDITPLEAKSVFGIKGKRKEVKKASVEAVLNKYPFLKKIDDNAADAISIALAGLKKLILN